MARRRRSAYRPATLRGGRAITVSGCFDPITHESDRVIRINTQRALDLRARGVPQWEAIRNVEPTLLAPDSVYEAADGQSHLYFKQIADLPFVPPEVTRAKPRPIFYVRVSVSETAPGRSPDFAFVWDYERADPETPILPLDRSPDRLSRRVV